MNIKNMYFLSMFPHLRFVKICRFDSYYDDKQNLKKKDGNLSSPTVPSDHPPCKKET